MQFTRTSPTILGRLGLAVAFTAVLAIAQPTEAQTLTDNNWLEQLRAYPVPEEQQTQAIQEFYTTQTDLVVLEQAMQTSGLPLNQLEIVTVVPVTWPDGCLGIYQPLSMCTMALVEGWVAVVSDGERSWAYHTTRGRARLNPALSGNDIPRAVLPEFDWPSVCWDDVTCRDWLWDSGLTQETPVMPKRNDAGTWVFGDAPTKRWFDPPMTPGFHYTISADSLFSDILDFPTGIDSDNLFTVTVGDLVLGQFGPGQRVNFVELMGAGVSEFTLSGIDPLVDAENPVAFPLKLGFTTPRASQFTMRPLSDNKPRTKVPEPSLLMGMLLFGVVGLKVGQRAV